MDFYKKSVEQCLKETSSCANGLSQEEAKRREKDVLHDEFFDEKRGIVSKFFAQFFDLMIIILLLASLVSIVIGLVQKTSEEIIDGVAILAIVVMNAIFGVVQEHKAEK